MKRIPILVSCVLLLLVGAPSACGEEGPVGRRGRLNVRPPAVAPADVVEEAPANPVDEGDVASDDEAAPDPEEAPEAEPVDDVTALKQEDFDLLTPVVQEKSGPCAIRLLTRLYWGGEGSNKHDESFAAATEKGCKDAVRSGTTLFRMSNGDVLMGHMKTQAKHVKSVIVWEVGDVVKRDSVRKTQVKKSTPHDLTLQEAREYTLCALWQEHGKAVEDTRPFRALSMLGQLMALQRGGFVDRPMFVATRLHVTGSGEGSIEQLALAQVTPCIEKARKDGTRCLECEGKRFLPCPDCGARGELISQCAACGSTGFTEKSCKKCGGRGYVSCPTTQTCRLCGGSGRRTIGTRNHRRSVQCIRCGGSGRVRCSICGGTGKLKCTRCGGKGKEPCAQCGGKGMIVKKCETCNGRKKVRCQTCNGKGAIKHPDEPGAEHVRAEYFEAIRERLSDSRAED